MNIYFGVEICCDIICVSRVWVCGIVWGGDISIIKCWNIFIFGVGYLDRGVKVVCGFGDSIYFVVR